MPDFDQRTLGNRLLRSLSGDDFALLARRLEHVPLELRAVLAQPEQPVAFAYFPESAISSLLLGPERTTGVEVGIIGREGLVNTSLLLGVAETPCQTIIQVAGEGWRIRSEDLLQAIAESRTLHASLLRYLHTHMVQLASTAYANADFTVEERLARWLLMCHDRTERDEIPLTHDFLALMLSVRRPGVTIATHVLEGEGMIRARRGRITIRDRDALIKLAGGSYGVAEAEYDRLISGSA